MAHDRAILVRDNQTGQSRNIDAIEPPGYTRPGEDMAHTQKKPRLAEMDARELLKKYGQYAAGPERTRELMDAAMGKRTLTSLLYEERGLRQ